MFYAISDTLLKVSLNTNKTGHHFIRYTWLIVGKWDQAPIKLVTMLYIIPDILLKVVLNTNKTGDQVLHYNWHIVESVVKHQ